MIKLKGGLGGKGHQYQSPALCVYTCESSQASHIPVVQYLHVAVQLTFELELHTKMRRTGW